MNATIAFDAYVLTAFLIVALIGTTYLSGRIAQHRGRSFRSWAWIAGIVIGPLAIPLLYLLPNLHRDNGDRA
jgi:MFS family permease